MTKCLLISLLLALLPAWSGAQQTGGIVVSGTVTTTEGNEPLPGVTVTVKGTTTGTVTDANGVYEIVVPSGISILTFSYIGYQMLEVEVGAQRTIDIRLEENIAQLDEVVVIGLGERRKRDLTGSISTVGSDAIEKIPLASPEFALQGNATGVRVVNASGNPNEGPEIYIRGIGTWNGSAQPLYVIDGQIISPPTAANLDLIGQNNLWTLINPSDIESISVLKDASAAAIYGSRGANGVILITTKRGKGGRPRVEFDAQTGIQNIPTFDLLTSEQFVRFNRSLFENSLNPDLTLEDDLYGRNETTELGKLNNRNPQFDPQSPYYLGESPNTYNWQDELINQDALLQNYNLKLSGSSEAANYYISLGYLDQESAIRGSDLTRYNLTTNVATEVGRYIRAGLTYRGAFEQHDFEQPGDLIELALTPPWQPIYDPNGPLGFGFAAPLRPYDASGAYQPARLYGQSTRPNFLANYTLNDGRFDLLRNAGQAYIEVEPLEGLTFRGGLSLDYIYQQRRQFTNVDATAFTINAPDPATRGNGNSYGELGLRTNRFLNYQADFLVNYNRTFGEHTFDALFSIQDQYYKRWNEDVSTNNLSTNDRDRLFIPNDQPNVAGFSGRDQKFWFGYVGRLSYNYAYRYYLDLSYRRDGSSGFPSDRRWGNFYAVSGAWRISEEPFMQGVSFINDLKLRGGWGQAGNDEAVVGAYAYLSRVNEQASYAFGSGNGDAFGNYLVAIAINDLPNRDLTWETVTTSYVGFDALMFNNKVNATVELYERRTDDILQFVQLPFTVGVNDPASNIGAARNRGIDLLLGWNNSAGDFTYNISGNISFVENTVLDLYNNQPLFTALYGRVEEGRSIGHIWGYRLGGIFRTQAEIEAFYSNNPDNNVPDVSYVGPGDMYFLDVHGDPTADEPFYSRTPDGQINANDQTEIGKTIPGFTYGLNLGAGWKGFDLTVNFYGEGDVDRVNEARQVLENTSSTGVNRSVAVLNAWTPSNADSSIPRAIAGDPAGNNRFSSRWVESAAFFRLNTWQLGYSLPASLLDRTSVLNRLRIFVGGQNNIYITNWSGIDPVNDRYPLPSGYFLGVNATF